MNRVLLWLASAILASDARYLTRNDHQNYRIIGGQDALIEDYPYTVSVCFEDTHICGGVIINEETILTAAHCVDGCENMIEVRLGSRVHYSGSYFDVKKILLHPDYNVANMDSDVALLKLSRLIRYNDEAQPIRIAEYQDWTSYLATVTGWGENDTYPVTFLQKLNVVVLDHGYCKEKYGWKKFTENMLCVSTDGGDTCDGDAGGPLVTNGYLIGIVSFGYGCARPNFPSIYVDIGKFRDWISTHMYMK